MRWEGGKSWDLGVGIGGRGRSRRGDRMGVKVGGGG